MELAKTVLYIALLVTVFSVYLWYNVVRSKVGVDDTQAFIADICWLASRPENTSFSGIYSLDLVVEDGRIVSKAVYDPQCGSFVFDGTHYIYSLPVRVSETLVLEGSVKLILKRRGGGVWVSRA